MTTANKKFGLRECAFSECGKTFEKTRTNMVYCCIECSRAATNAKLLARYHNRKRLRSLVRKCNGCEQKLSRYNRSEICYSCQNKKENQERIDLLARLGIQYIDEDA